MSLRKPGNTKKIELINNTSSIFNANNSNPRSLSHNIDPDNTTYILPEITLEDLDKMIINEFDNLFQIDGKQLRLINGMIDSTSAKFLYPEIFNQEKETFITPLFAVNRVSAQARGRSNPSYKPVVFTVPKVKAQGTVFEEYTITPSLYYNMVYEFMFTTTYKQHSNEFIDQIRTYFKNKRTLITLHNEKFCLRPTQGIEQLFDESEEEDVNGIKMYVVNFSLLLEGYTRSKDSVQKRERPNIYALDVVVKDTDNTVVNINRSEIRFK